MVINNTLPMDPFNQSLVHNKASAFFGRIELRYFPMTWPLILKADSEATLVIGMLRISRAIDASSGYRILFAFQ